MRGCYPLALVRGYPLALMRGLSTGAGEGVNIDK